MTSRPRGASRRTRRSSGSGYPQTGATKWASMSSGRSNPPSSCCWCSVAVNRRRRSPVGASGASTRSTVVARAIGVPEPAGHEDHGPAGEGEARRLDLAVELPRVAPPSDPQHAAPAAHGGLLRAEGEAETTALAPVGRQRAARGRHPPRGVHPPVAHPERDVVVGAGAHGPELAPRLDREPEVRDERGRRPVGPVGADVRLTEAGGRLVGGPHVLEGRDELRGRDEDLGVPAAVEVDRPQDVGRRTSQGDEGTAQPEPRGGRHRHDEPGVCVHEGELPEGVRQGAGCHARPRVVVGPTAPQSTVATPASPTRTWRGGRPARCSVCACHASARPPGCSTASGTWPRTSPSGRSRPGPSCTTWAACSASAPRSSSRPPSSSRRSCPSSRGATSTARVSPFRWARQSRSGADAPAVARSWWPFAVSLGLAVAAGVVHWLREPGLYLLGWALMVAALVPLAWTLVAPGSAGERSGTDGSRDDAAGDAVDGPGRGRRAGARRARGAPRHRPAGRRAAQRGGVGGRLRPRLPVAADGAPRRRRRLLRQQGGVRRGDRADPDARHDLQRPDAARAARSGYGTGAVARGAAGRRRPPPRVCRPAPSSTS